MIGTLTCAMKAETDGSVVKAFIGPGYADNKAASRSHVTGLFRGCHGAVGQVQRCAAAVLLVI